MELRRSGLQLLSAAIFAPLAADILLFQDNRRGTPNLKHLLGGLWIFTFLTGAQTVLLALVTPFALLFTRRRWALVRHQCAAGMRFMFDSFPYGRLERIDLGVETFEKPAILVSNHQSSVDIPLILSLPTDVRLLVGRRVWRTPVLGIGARCLDHVPVEPDEPAVTLERCRVKLAAGASLHAFPEGTRSQGGYPNRFRRGAFEIACELRADVLPIVLCNTRSCVPRDAFWVGDFWMSVKALPRVTPVEFDYELGARALMQHVQQLVRAEVEAENRRIHSHRPYLLAHVAGLYRFQGRFLRRRVRRRLRTSREAPPWIDALSNFGSVLVLESELGVLGHLASLPNLRLNCVVELQAPRDLRAAHVSAASNERLSFVEWGSSDASRVEFDAVVIARGVDGSELVPRLTSLAPETLVLLEVANEALEAELRESGFQPRANLAQAYERVASSGHVS